MIFWDFLQLPKDFSSLENWILITSWIELFLKPLLHLSFEKLWFRWKVQAKIDFILLLGADQPDQIQLVSIFDLRLALKLQPKWIKSCSISIWRCKFHQKSIKCWSKLCVTLIINQSKVGRSGGLTLIKFRDEILIKWIKSWSRMVPVFSRHRSRGVTLRCDFDQVVQIFPD